MTRLEPFQQLARLCAQKGIENVIISPGSRNAALTIAFVNEKKLNCFSISDERSAAYLALGMALQTLKPTVIICTSGTAALNYAPAVAEAYFQEIPLLVLTADRPPEWIHQYDGQTIFQNNVYGRHAKRNYEWLADQTETNLTIAQNLSIEAIDQAMASPQGPVHINIPIREPFYPEKVEDIFTEWSFEEKRNHSNKLPLELKKDFLSLTTTHSRKLLVVGQQHSPKVKTLARLFANKFGFVVVADSISNVSESIQNHDQFLKNYAGDSLAPDFLISLDKSLISKSLKLMLRKSDIVEHWHIQANSAFIDPFLSLKTKIEVLSEEFLEQMLEIGNNQNSMSYQNLWQKADAKATVKVRDYFKEEAFSEFHVLKSLLTSLPPGIVIHSGNSMSIRYINALQSLLPNDCTIFCNRGTSGIDGSLSTAVGQAMCTEKPVFCVLGDVSFQYDKNALWNRYLPKNLKIIILNNAGGMIFSMIEGPKKQTAFEDFFKTYQPNKADLIAQEFGLSYFSIRNLNELELKISNFINGDKASILEVFTDAEFNEKAFKAFFK